MNEESAPPIKRFKHETVNTKSIRITEIKRNGKSNYNSTNGFIVSYFLKYEKWKGKLNSA